MSDRDEEGLSELFATLRHEKPEPRELERWNLAVARELRRAVVSPRRRWLDLAAAVIVGVLIGATAFGHRASESSGQQNALNHATNELVVTKLN